MDTKYFDKSTGILYIQRGTSGYDVYELVTDVVGNSYYRHSYFAAPHLINLEALQALPVYK